MKKNLTRNMLPLLCRALARLCLRHGLKLNEIVNAMKQALVEAAEENLTARQEPISVSKLSVMTGVHRPDITQMQKENVIFQSTPDFLTRIIWKWQQERAYCTKAGSPRTLSSKGNESEFAELVRSVSTALNPYTVLFELERAGNIRRTARGVKLTQPEAEPFENPETALKYLAQDTLDLTIAVDENIFRTDPTPKNHHITTEYDAIAHHHIPAARNWLLSEGRKFHSRLRKYLGDLDKGSEGSKKDHVRIVFGSFSRVEEQLIPQGD